MLDVTTSEDFEHKMSSYPVDAQQHLHRLRSLVREVAATCEDVDEHRVKHLPQLGFGA